MRILDVLNEANNHKPFGERVSYKEFYNDAINKEVDLNSDFNMWIKERDDCRKKKIPFDRLRVFSLCSFAWILDSANKASILKVANRYNQQREQLSNPLDILMGGRLGMDLIFDIRRDHILDDALTAISKPGLNF